MRDGSVSAAGLGLAVVSGASFGTSGSFAASLIAIGWTPGAAVLARVVIAAAVLTVPALAALRRHDAPVRRTAVRGVVLYGVVAVGGAQLCYFNAVQHLSVAVALLLEYSGILLVIAWQWVVHGQRPRWLTRAGGALALAGLVLVLDLLNSHRLDVTGVVWGLGAAVGLAVYFVLSSATDDALPPVTVAWGGLVVGAVALAAAAGVGALPVHAVGTDVRLAGHAVSWVVPVLGMALVAAVVAYAAGIKATRLLGAKLASFVGLTEVLCAVVFAWLLVGQHLDVVQLLGGVLVLAGIALVQLDELRAPDRRSGPAPAPARRVVADAAA